VFVVVLKPPVTLGGKFEIYKATENSTADKNRRICYFFAAV
jgi:hypothetical protein